MSDSAHSNSWEDVAPSVVPEPPRVSFVPTIADIDAVIERLHGRKLAKVSGSSSSSSARVLAPGVVSQLTLSNFRRSVQLRIPILARPSNPGRLIAAMEDVSADYPEVPHLDQIRVFKDRLSEEVLAHLALEQNHRKCLENFFEALRRALFRMQDPNHIQQRVTRLKQDRSGNFADRAVEIFHLSRSLPGVSEEDAIRECYEIQAGTDADFRERLLAWLDEHQGRLDFADFLNHGRTLQTQKFPKSSTPCKFQLKHGACTKKRCKYLHQL